MIMQNAIGECFALLDDCDATLAAPRSRLYTGYLGTLACHDASELPQQLSCMEQALGQSQFAIGLFAYELGCQLHDIATHEIAEPLAKILLFSRCEHLSAAEVETFLQNCGTSADDRAGIAQLRASVTDAEFADGLARIHDYIDAGDTYQVNMTYRLRFESYGSAVALYRKLRTRQPVPYGALIVLPDGRAVLSLSPELFVRLEDGQLTAQPMKGTAAASSDPAENARRSAALAADPKNRAENVMIVDLLRNDLGRVAEVGSVTVPRLFDVDRYADVLQMTSTVQARLRSGATLADIFAALFPCGSITGAPKRRTLQIIRELEPDARRLYTGAIGWFDAPASPSACGDFCLSVPIRTLLLDAPDDRGLRTGEMGIGAGIVHDSDVLQEAAECRLKARFLTGLPAGFELFETMCATRDGCRHVDRHLQRLQSSAAYFNFPYDEQMARSALHNACMSLSFGVQYRMRLALNQAGDIQVTTAVLTPLSLPVRLMLSSTPTDRGDLFLQHKTTRRERYDAGWRAAEARGAFDMLFFNGDGELTEGGRSNVFVKLDGCWYTPPLDAGVLPGVMRAVLLSDAAWDATERRLTREDVQAAEELIVCNALRGVMPAMIDWNATH